MNKYRSKDLKIGLKVVVDGQPFIILESEFRKPGKGQAFNRLKLRNLKSNKIIKKTLKIGEVLQSADFYYKEVKFLYYDRLNFYFIDIVSCDYYEVNNLLLEDNKYWFVNGNIYDLVLMDGNVFDVKIPKVMILKVISIDTGEVSVVLSKNTKYAKLETGICIKVPLFIKVNDVIKVDTDSKEYISRVS